ncbi:uncharacterized protein ACNLHF_009252 [Anomaloglossus baeobatrachus]
MDDVSVYCTSSAAINRAVLDTEIFSAGSGFKLNKEKCDCFIVGQWEPEPPKIPVQNDGIKILGIHFDEQNDGCKNWDLVLTRLSQKISLWQLRKLTMEGKILIIKMILLPIILYAAMVFPPNSLYFKRLMKPIFYFLWNSKMEKLKRITVCKSKRNGGKGLPDLKLFLLIKFFVFCYKSLNNAGAFTCFLRYSTGYVFKKLHIDILPNRPVLLSPPKQYKILETIISEYDLINVDKGVLSNQRKLTAACKGHEIMEDVANFSPSRCRLIWNNVSCPALSNTQKDLAWQIVHQCLPTRAFQHRRGLVASARCPRDRCAQEETVFHLFWYCTYAQEVWQAVGTLLKWVCGLRTLNCDVVLYGIIDCPTMYQAKIAWLIINSFKEALWKTRNILLFKHDCIPVKDCIGLALCTMYTYYLRDCKKQ